MSENDLEIDYARRLGALLRDIRRDLTDDAAETLLEWTLKRAGVVALISGMRPVPAPRRPQPAPKPSGPPAFTVQNDPPPAARTNGETPLILTPPSKKGFPCPEPDCQMIARNRAGLAAHVRAAHKRVTEGIANEPH